MRGHKNTLALKLPNDAPLSYRLSFCEILVNSHRIWGCYSSGYEKKICFLGITAYSPSNIN
jgi:hypothetical protein